MKEPTDAAPPASVSSEGAPPRDEQASQVAADLSHDLNNVLTIILGHCELAAAEKNVPVHVRNDLEEIAKAARSGRDIVEELKALSRRYGGSTNAAPDATATPEASDGPAALPARARRHILLLDDDEPLIYLATQALTALGNRVSGFESADKALAALHADAGAFDLVVTDYNLPELSGLEIARDVARIRPGLPVLLMSGAVSDEMRAACVHAGNYEILEKPMSVKTLCEWIDQSLTQAQSG